METATEQMGLLRAMLRNAREMFDANTRQLSLHEALFHGGSARSIVGVMKHLGGWLWVYRSSAFEPEPKHWQQIGWPGGLRNTIEPSTDYVAGVRGWVLVGFDAWDESLAGLDEVAAGEPRPLHWGARLPRPKIVLLMAQHVAFHTGEINMLLSTARGEAWEWGEEVEENYIDTTRNGVRPPWMTDEQAARYLSQHPERRP
jgi:hypothetical protein